MTTQTDQQPTHCGRCAIIAAVGLHGELGKDGDLIWHLRGDLRRFKSLTMGHPVIMGRRTWQSLPKGALPGRRNIVVTRQVGFDAPGAETAHSLEEALALCCDGPEPFVIGGGEIYREAFPLAGRLYLTHVDAGCAGADTYFPEVKAGEWECVARSEGAAGDGVMPSFAYADYIRRR